MTTVDFIIRLIIAILLGTAIGLEREWRHKSAGFRTTTLVCMGSCAFVMLSFYIGGDATGRIASYVISGIGFLGAGVIMKDGFSVRGLNTAATIWCSAAVGCIVAVGKYPEAVVFSLSIIMIHLVFRPISKQIARLSFNDDMHEETNFLIKIRCKEEVENKIRVLLMQFISDYENIKLKSLSSDDEKNDPSFVFISAEVLGLSNEQDLIEEISSKLTNVKEVQKVSWENLGSNDDL